VTQRRHSVLLHKKGRRTYGAYYTRKADGARFYMAFRKTKQIFRSGEADISTAIRSGTACWALDEDLLIDLRAAGIKFVGVLDRDTGDKYMTALDMFFNPQAAIMNYTARGGSLQRYLPLKFFRRQVGKAKL
jgi:hypothetical protein